MSSSTDSVYFFAHNEVNALDKFHSLPADKQSAILNAALAAFAANGYKKASASDIAGAASISKAMVFHYFGTKKALYLHLVRYCGQLIIGELEEKFDSANTDFFQRISMASDIKMSVLRKHPAVLLFLESAFFEQDPEVKEDVQAYFSNSEFEEFRNKLAFQGMDEFKFKESVDPKLVLKMLVWFSYGYMSSSGKAGINMDELLEEFHACMHMLRNHFYKPEYL